MGKKTIQSITCMLDGREIGIQEALGLRNQAGRSSPDFRCVECGQKVTAFNKACNGNIAHFEHRSKNESCSLSIAHHSRN
jgi:hypothetical protein